MNGNRADIRCDEEKQLDLLPHRYRPDSVNRFRCHPQRAQRLKQWIEEFIDLSKRIQGGQINSDYSDSSCSSEASANLNVIKKCVLLTGPPGVGKTSLVYTIAHELKLHVIESHSSEKRDFKLFSMLKLTNQKGRINPIAKLFQATQLKHQQTTRRKRRKLAESNQPNQPNQPQGLSLSGAISIVLFDDIDVTFEEDGPFLKSLVEFIKESKRPIILTATQSIDYIKSHINEVLIYCEHIDLPRPNVEDCAKLLRDICRTEGYHKLSKISRCRALATHYDCDIRQCLNRIHLFGDEADKEVELELDGDCIRPDFCKLELENFNKTILQCYTNASLTDLMAVRYHSFDRSILLNNWLNGRPNHFSEGYDSGQSLGNQIRESIMELDKKLHSNQLMTKEDLMLHRNNFTEVRNELILTTQQINSKINCRIEPPEKEFFSDVMPLFGALVSLDADKRSSGLANGGSARRSRRILSYLDDIKVYLEPDRIQRLADLATMRSAQEAIDVRENARVPEQK